MSDTPPVPSASVRLSAAVAIERDGKVLVLKRAMGEATGGWYLPGGAVEPGEDIEEAARRELFEEAGIAPGTPLSLIGAVRMQAYGRASVQFLYACEAADGDVVISDEHSAARWIDPVEYRDRYLGDELIAQAAARDAHLGGLMSAVREGFDKYLDWRAHQFLDKQLRVLRLTAEMFVLREGKMLLLKRGAGLGEGVWYVPGGVVEPGEDPEDAAVRETVEESGLHVANVRQLRVWSYPAQNDLHAFHAAYVGESASGDVVLSHEHTAHRWITPAEYADRYCSDQQQAAVPQWARWMQQVRRNCQMVAAVIEG